MDAISFLVMNFIQFKLVDELPVSAHPQVGVLAKQRGLFVGKVCLGMNQSDDSTCR